MSPLSTLEDIIVTDNFSEENPDRVFRFIEHYCRGIENSLLLSTSLLGDVSEHAQIYYDTTIGAAILSSLKDDWSVVLICDRFRNDRSAIIKEVVSRSVDAIKYTLQDPCFTENRRLSLKEFDSLLGFLLHPSRASFNMTIFCRRIWSVYIKEQSVIIEDGIKDKIMLCRNGVTINGIVHSFRFSAIHKVHHLVLFILFKDVELSKTNFFLGRARDKIETTKLVFTRFPEESILDLGSYCLYGDRLLIRFSNISVDESLDYYLYNCIYKMFIDPNLLKRDSTFFIPVLIDFFSKEDKIPRLIDMEIRIFRSIGRSIAFCYEKQIPIGLYLGLFMLASVFLFDLHCVERGRFENLNKGEAILLCALIARIDGNGCMSKFFKQVIIFHGLDFYSNILLGKYGRYLEALFYIRVGMCDIFKNRIDPINDDIYELLSIPDRWHKFCDFIKNFATTLYGSHRWQVNLIGNDIALFDKVCRCSFDRKFSQNLKRHLARDKKND